MITAEITLNLIFGGGIAFMFWMLKMHMIKFDALRELVSRLNTSHEPVLVQVQRLEQRVDEHDSRITKLETILEIMGDIRSDISTIKTDIEVLKAKSEG